MAAAFRARWDDHFSCPPHFEDPPEPDQINRIGIGIAIERKGDASVLGFEEIDFDPDASKSRKPMHRAIIVQSKRLVRVQQKPVMKIDGEQFRGQWRAVNLPKNE
ncbi:hypothetical protein [Desulfatitalea alkaliphila]|uniref:Uncharacterized protein n=1 Tax=Desulfatitalea alkaliphila TaxID=2929485 RepID=A0AA41R442_9BACT|nr:hypothetical protein [Desulfatitalea alkaliphila]MCJ8501999.1 hypothetical protein [Desulfatitalea alkaliphila]